MIIYIVAILTLSSILAMAGWQYCLTLVVLLALQPVGHCITLENLYPFGKERGDFVLEAPVTAFKDSLSVASAFIWPNASWTHFFTLHMREDTFNFTFYGNTFTPESIVVSFFNLICSICMVKSHDICMYIAAVMLMWHQPIILILHVPNLSLYYLSLIHI